MDTPATLAPSPLSPRWQTWAWIFLAWTVLGLLSFAQSAMFSTYSGTPVNWMRLPTALADWYTCGVFTPAFIWIVRRYPLSGRRWWTNVPAHLVGSLVFVLAKVAIYHPIFRLLNPRYERSYLDMLLGSFYVELLGYLSVVGVLYALEYYREAQVRALEAVRLDTALRSAELENLKAQLHPHFLFNTLQAISTLLHRDPAAADRMLTDLSDLLRVSIRHGAAQEVSLRDELAFLGSYLDIMRTRFGDRLAIEVDVPDSLLDAMVPSLVLQPLAENAIRHGMADRTDRGSVAIRGWRDNHALVLEVKDDGPGLSRDSSHGEGNGIGLANTRGRLARLYGPGYGIEMLPSGNGDPGISARLTIPFRLRAAEQIA